MKYFGRADYETLRALDTDNSSGTLSMSDEEINALPVHNYKIPGLKRYTNTFDISGPEFEMQLS